MSSPFSSPQRSWGEVPEGRRGGHTALLFLVLACTPKKPAPPHEPKAPLLYFVMVDRFHNGDPTNDKDIDPSDPHAFHGGDLQGVIDHLDHLDSLGVTHLWLSPIFEMRDEKIGEWGAFHGYWVKDLARIEPRFGDERTLRRLADELHRRDMKLVLDIVWNHTDYDAPLLAAHPDWYHPTGDIQDWSDPVERVTGRVHGLPDLAQEKEPVYRHLADTSLGWIERARADGFRVDAVGHMPLDFLARINAELDAEHPGFWTVGEDFQGDPMALARTLDEGGFDAVFDFPLRYAMVDVFCKDASFHRLASILSLDRLYEDPNRLVTFLDNHDLPRVLTECNEETRRLDPALAFLFLSRGMPGLAWGTELMLEGGEEPDNRRDMPWDRLGGARDRSMLLKQLQALRAGSEALQKGRQVVLQLEEHLLVTARATDRQLAILSFSRGEPIPESAWGQAEGVKMVRIFDSGGALLRHHLQILDWGGKGPAPWAHLLEEPPMHRLVVETRTPAGEDQLRLVGAGPELGAWDPEKGIPLVDGRASVDLPGGSVPSFKLVRRRADGLVTWPEGPDHALLLPREPGETRMQVEAPGG